MTKIRSPKSDNEAAFRAGAAKQIMRATDHQIDAYIDANVTSLQEAKDFLKETTKLLKYTVRYVAKKRER